MLAAEESAPTLTSPLPLLPPLTPTRTLTPNPNPKQESALEAQEEMEAVQGRADEANEALAQVRSRARG
jgi:hypothetical protein